MATTRLMPLHIGKGRTVGTAIAAIIDYVENPEKTDNGNLITSWQCDSRVADSEFLFSKQQYIKNTGRVRGSDDVIAYHLRQSFRPGEITPEEANRLGCELARRFTKGNHAYIVCTHIDKAHIHNHVIWNSTALDERSKFRNFWGSTKALRRLNDTICVENGYSIVENPKGKSKTYDKWLGDQKKPSHRERICYAIDEALAQKPQSFEKLLELLQRSGYQVKGGKVPSLLGEGQKRFIRMDTLGAGYTPDDHRAIIAGTKEHTPKKKRVMDAPANVSGSLLIDIQAKLQEGKGAGYARWAKNFNLKQLSQTLIYRKTCVPPQASSCFSCSLRQLVLMHYRTKIPKSSRASSRVSAFWSKSTERHFAAIWISALRIPRIRSSASVKRFSQSSQWIRTLHFWQSRYVNA